MARTAIADEPTLIAFKLPTHPEAVSIARMYVRAILWFQGLDQYADEAEIVTSELVSNVIQHVCSDGTDTMIVTLKHTRNPDVVAICVTDSSSNGPVRREPSEGSERGRGLLIVEELSYTWEWGLCDGGKDVVAILASNAEPETQGQRILAERRHEGQAAVIGANIRALRQRKGWSQARLAELMGWHSASIVCAAEGHRNGRQRSFTTREIRRLAAIFGIPPRQLKAQCANCDGHPPMGFACLTCGATPEDHPPVAPALSAPLHLVQDGQLAVRR